MDPASGQLAGGDSGTGRLREPQEIFELVERIVRGYRGVLTGKRVLISAGGTREPIDPVRVLTNRSSGRQGHALAEVAQRLGALVTLVTSANVSLALDVVRSVEVLRVESAAQMRAAMLDAATHSDAIIMAAAVSDFTVVPSTKKLKKDAGTPELALQAAPDILMELVGHRKPGQIIVGFAAETNDVEQHALEKLRRKGVDLLVVNDVSSPNVGFEHSTNEVTLFDRHEASTKISLRSKEAVSYEILSRVASLLNQGAP